MKTKIKNLISNESCDIYLTLRLNFKTRMKEWNYNLITITLEEDKGFCAEQNDKSLRYCGPSTMQLGSSFPESQEKLLKAVDTTGNYSK